MEQRTTLVPAINDRDHRKGEISAPMTLVLFGDYECPFSARANSIAKELKKSLGNDLCFVFRHFPLTKIHANAMMAAQAAEIAGNKGLFWEMHDHLFENQYMLGRRNLVKHAKKLGLDVKEFKKSLEEDRFASNVKEDIDSGINSGVYRTPTFFVNNQRHEDSYQFDILREKLQLASRY